MEEPDGKPGRRINYRLVVAELLYLALAVVATLAFDGVVRTVFWLYFILLAVKTLAAARRDDEP